MRLKTFFEWFEMIRNSSDWFGMNSYTKLLLKRSDVRNLKIFLNWKPEHVRESEKLRTFGKTRITQLNPEPNAPDPTSSDFGFYVHPFFCTPLIVSLTSLRTRTFLRKPELDMTRSLRCLTYP